MTLNQTKQKKGIVGGDTCSCMSSSKHATAPPLKQNNIELWLQTRGTLVVVGPLEDMQLTSLLDKTTQNCSRVEDM